MWKRDIVEQEWDFFQTHNSELIVKVNDQYTKQWHKTFVWPLKLFVKWLTLVSLKHERKKTLSDAPCVVSIGCMKSEGSKLKHGFTITLNCTLQHQHITWLYV